MPHVDMATRYGRPCRSAAALEPSFVSGRFVQSSRQPGMSSVPAAAGPPTLPRWAMLDQAAPVAVWQVVIPLIAPRSMRVEAAFSTALRRVRRPSGPSACTFAPTGAAPSVRMR